MKRKVLFLIESLSGGGAEKVLSVLLKHLNQDKFEVTLCTVVDTGVYVEEVKPYVHYTSILGNPNRKSILGKLGYHLRYKLVYQILPLKWVYQLFVPKNHDVEVAFVEGFATKLLSFSTNTKARKIAWVHIDLLCNPWTTIHKVFKNVNDERNSYLKYNQIVGVSDTVCENFKKKYSIYNIKRIYNPLDKGEIVRKSLENSEYKKDSFVFLSIGRLVEQKGYDRLLRVVVQLKEKGFIFKLLILGNGSDYRTLKDFIDENGLYDTVYLLGFVSNPYKYMRMADAFICSSRSEGFSLVIAEAMILGLPIISTYCSGPNELLEEGRWGMLVENSENGIFIGMRKILESSSLLEDYREKSVKGAELNNLSDSLAQIEDILQ